MGYSSIDLFCTRKYLIQKCRTICLKTKPKFSIFCGNQQYLPHKNIVNRGKCLGSPANIKGANIDAKIKVGRSMTVQNLLFCTHKLFMSYVTNTFLLVRFSVNNGVNNYCFFCTVKAKKASKNIQQRALSSFITIPSY